MRRCAALIALAVLASCSSVSAPTPVGFQHVRFTSAASAWPDRGIEPPPVAAQEIAKACAIADGCGLFDFGLCSSGDSWEELAIPLGDMSLLSPNAQGMRFAWLVRQTIALVGHCNDVAAMITRSWPVGIACQDDGCSWANPPSPSWACAGDVASVTWSGKKFARDCTRSFARCDATSPTGCSDRRPTTCAEGRIDFCDGDVKLGCRGGHVVFHDCALVGAHCVENDPGAECRRSAPDACRSTDVACVDAATLRTCVRGSIIDIDCTTLGFSVCTGARCTK